jgi:phage minor structural protein
MNQVAILDNCIEAKIEQEVASIDEITFSLPMRDSKRNYIVNEGYVQMFDTIYVIREIVDYKKSRITEVYAEAIWYDLQYQEPLTVLAWQEVKATVMLTDILKDTGWRIGTVEFTNSRSLTVSADTNRLEALRNVESLFEGELWFDTQAKTVSLKKPLGVFTGASITYDKNADDIEAHHDTKDLITKLYVYGKDGMTIADANSGKAYVENYSYTTTKRVRIMSDERYTNPFNLKEVADNAIAYLCKPRASYVVKMAELVSQAKLPHEAMFLGGTVRMYDKELNLDVETRIMKWTYNIIEPWRTELNLETKAKTLSDLLTGVDNYGDSFTSEDAVDKAEMLELSVFNYLMNSRADDDYAYWTNSGWVVDPANGYSGNASFKAVGELGREKALTQTVRPSTSDTYAISFRAYADNIVKGDTAQVGVEITVKYEDGTSDAPKFISLIT